MSVHSYMTHAAPVSVDSYAAPRPALSSDAKHNRQPEFALLTDHRC
jgi:hypothetical protein